MEKKDLCWKRASRNGVKNISARAVSKAPVLSFSQKWFWVQIYELKILSNVYQKLEESLFLAKLIVQVHHWIVRCLRRCNIWLTLDSSLNNSTGYYH